MPQADINLLAVLISAVVSMVIGSLWFGALFGKAWMKEMKFDNKKIQAMKKKGMGKSYFVNFLGTFVMAYILSHFVDYMGAVTFNQGMWTGFLVWLGFFATSMLGMMLWEGRSFKLYSIHVLYHLVNLYFN